MVILEILIILDQGYAAHIVCLGVLQYTISVLADILDILLTIMLKCTLLRVLKRLFVAVYRKVLLLHGFLRSHFFGVGLWGPLGRWRRKSWTGTYVLCYICGCACRHVLGHVC